MACVCDECDEEIPMSEAIDLGGEIICRDCFELWDDEDEEEDVAESAPVVVCSRCQSFVSEKFAFSKNEGVMCVRCAHAHELSIFTPPDHSAAECQLCTAH
jgi:formylmethanofuran dehydrogenase subunit E